MKFSRLIAFRYLHASRENRFFSWITILAILGISIGVAALIVVLSVFNGFETEVRTRMLQANSHIWVTNQPMGFKDPAAWAKSVFTNAQYGHEVKAMAPFVYSFSMAKKDSLVSGVIIRGIIPKQQEKVQSSMPIIQPPSALQDLQREINDAIAGKPRPEVPKVILGSDLGKNLQAQLGDVIRIIDPVAKGLSTSRPYKVAGFYNSGLQDMDKRLVLLSLQAAQDLTGMGKRVTGLSIALKNPEKASLVAYQMGLDYLDMTFKDWKSFNSRFFEIMDGERVRVGFIVALVGIVAAFNILTTVFVSVSQRQRDISILKALGATNSDIMKVFLIQSSAIGIGGSVLGVILAGSISYSLQTFPLFDLPDPYFLKTLPVSYSFSVYAGICGAASFICLCAGLYPAFIASRVNPTEGIAGTGHAI
ncbi:MAG: ABC transporter permease [Oligoflexus sp.]|nr:ABC transporter permease [Oligoflexus sp.]